MKRYMNDAAGMFAVPDGEWTRYEDHVEAMKCIAGDSAQAEPVAWGLRIGDSDVWSYTTTEADADFWGRGSGLRYEKRPLYAAPAPSASQRAEPAFWVPEADANVIARRLGAAVSVMAYANGGTAMGDPLVPFYAAPAPASPECQRCKPYRDATGELVAPLCRCKPSASPAPTEEFMSLLRRCRDEAVKLGRYVDEIDSILAAKGASPAALTDREAFEAWHNSFYGPQGKYNPIRSLAHDSCGVGLGYDDPTVQAQFVAFCGALLATPPEA